MLHLFLEFKLFLVIHFLPFPPKLFLVNSSTHICQRTKPPYFLELLTGLQKGKISLQNDMFPLCISLFSPFKITKFPRKILFFQVISSSGY